MKVLRMSETVDTVADLIRLRRWTLKVIGERQDSASAAEALRCPEVPLETWTFFLMLERCASTLLVSLEAAENMIPDDVRSLLVSVAREEMKQVLQAEREIRQLGQKVEDAGATIILLKGGVPAVMRANPPLPLRDVDVLVPRGSHELVETVLAAAGFTRAENDELHHACWYPLPGRLPVEVHWTTNSDGSPIDPDVWRRVMPIEDVRGAARLDYADQVVHLLRHALDQHRDQHVSLRDVLLIGWFANLLSIDEQRQVTTAVQRLSNPERYRELLSFSESVHARSRSKDPFEEDAILHFTAAALLRNEISVNGRLRPAWHNAAAVAAKRVSLRRLIVFASRSPVTAISTFASLQRKAPAVGAIVTRGARAAHYFASALVGIPLLIKIKHKVLDRLRESSV